MLLRKPSKGLKLALGNCAVMPKPRKERKCYACGFVGSIGFAMNYDNDDNALCKACYNYYVRRPPKKLTTTYRESIKTRRCSECGNTKPNPGGKEQYWMRHKTKEGTFVCLPCYSRLYLRAKNNPRRFAFKNKIVFASEFPRIGVCNLCRAVVGEIDAQANETCRRTSLHHENYYKENPMKDTIEVCSRCHAKITKAETVEKNKARFCCICKSNKTDLVRGKHPSWMLLRDEADNAICKNCYDSLRRTHGLRVKDIAELGVNQLSTIAKKRIPVPVT